VSSFKLQLQVEALMITLVLLAVIRAVVSSTLGDR
jgi:hypothetical protein